MRQLLDALLGGGPFMPHGACYLWRPGLVRLHVISDLVTGIAYYAIPPTLLYLVVRARRESPPPGSDRPPRLPYDWMFLAFALFIVACGTTHFLAAWTVWTPAYWLSGSVKAVTAAASLASALLLPPLVPRALQLLRNAWASEARRLELEATNRELERMHRRLRELDELKTRFFANVSHELRTPLSLILGPTESLLAPGRLDAEARRSIGVIERNARTLARHVDDLLDIAQLEAGRAELRATEVDLARLTREAAAHFEVLAGERRLRFEVDAPETLAATLDIDKVRRILLNLLSNAFKLTPPGGVVRTALRRLAGDRVRIDVADSGPGVPEALREVIFERFRQADDSATRQYGGTGLGLAISREFALLHGGALSVGEAPEGGACFTLTLPLKAPSADDGTPPTATGRLSDGASFAAELAPVTVPPPTAPADGGRPLVLVVEDHPAMSRHLAATLAAEHRVITAHDGRQGLDSARRWRPDLVVCDVMMPGLSGDEMVRRLRRTPEGAEMAVLFLTAKADDELRLRMLQEGADDYVLKPLSDRELLVRTRKLLAAKRSRDLLRASLDSREADLEALAAAAAERQRLLARSLEARQLLLHEVHHRVKGNLQTVSSLLHLQARTIADPAARRAIEESRDRIHVMSLLHQRLYAGEDPGTIEIAGYLRSLVRQIRRTQAPEAVSVDLELPGEPLTLEATLALPCGMILYELTSNALRHAFPGCRTGRVRIGLSRQAGGLRLTVADDGVGLPDAVDWRRPTSLGLQLVQAFRRQVDGRLEVVRNGGTSVHLDLPQPAAGTESPP